MYFFFMILPFGVMAKWFGVHYNREVDINSNVYEKTPGPNRVGRRRSWCYQKPPGDFEEIEVRFSRMVITAPCMEKINFFCANGVQKIEKTSPAQ